MLKSVDPGPQESPSIGELAHRLIDDGKAYAEAEIGLLKAIANAKAKALVLPAMLLGVAFILALAAVAALSIGVVMALAKFTGPLLAGIVGLVLFAVIAAGLGWYGVERIRREL